MKIASIDWMNDYLTAAKEYARDYVLENTGLKVLALLITAVLWLSVASRPASEVALNGVAVVFRNLPDSPNLTVSKYPPLVARVYVEGPRDTVDALEAGQLTVIADMSGVEPGIRPRDLHIDPKTLPPNVKVKEIDPRQITVTVERVVERELPIVPRFEGEPPAGSEVIDWQIVPRTVTVSGAESQMREITEVKTESVTLADKSESFTRQVALDISSNLSIRQDTGRVTLTVNVGEARKERAIANVPVGLFGAPRRARVDPRFVTVTVYGPRSAVDALTASDLNVGVEYRPGSRLFAPKVTVSPDFAEKVGIRAVEPQQVRVY